MESLEPPPGQAPDEEKHDAPPNGTERDERPE
jgi:hypothetical protein